MKILMIGGAPDEYGSIDIVMKMLEGEFERRGIQTERYDVCDDIRGCLACGKCYRSSVCTIDDDVNRIAEKMKTADGLITAVPVVYGNASKKTVLFLERLFRSNPEVFSAKPAAAVPVMRRRDTEHAYEQLISFFEKGSMTVLTSASHFAVRGASREEIQKDASGKKNLDALCGQMTYLLRCIEAGKEKGLPDPEVRPEKDLSYYR